MVHLVVEFRPGALASISAATLALVLVSVALQSKGGVRLKMAGLTWCGLVWFDALFGSSHRIESSDVDIAGMTVGRAVE